MPRLPLPPLRARTGRAALWLLSLGVALASMRYLVLPVEEAGDAFVHHVAARPLVFYGHVALAASALALTPLQLSSRLRARRPGLHRIAGRIAAGAMVLGGIAGGALALTTSAGPVAAAGFGLLAVLWVGLTIAAVIAARRGEIARHRALMLRAAALTLAAVTLRLQLGLVFAFDLPFDAVYPVIAWGCWVPNLAIAEAILRRPRRAPAAAQPA